jgi:hypothetical protein
MILPVRLWNAAHSCSASLARAEADEEAALPAALAFALHDGFERVDCRAPACHRSDAAE